MDWEKIASDEVLEKTISALKANGMEAMVVETEEQAKEKVKDLLPQEAEVMNMTSVTLDTLSISEYVQDETKFIPIRKKLQSMDSDQKDEKRRIGAAPQVAIGSVHAVTEDGKVLIASATGSQLPAYAYGAEKVIWVVGAQKIVSDLEQGMKRINEYTLPLENERAKKVYGVGSAVNKLLIINKEATPKRITLIFVKKILGF